MSRTLLVLALLALAGPAAARPMRVRDALCVSWSGPPLLALAPDVRGAYLSALGRAGWRLVRTDFTWSAIEPLPGHLDFARYDRLVAEAARHRVRLLGLLDYGNPWAARDAPAGDDHWPPDDSATFARFAARTARRYRGRIPAWEIWNEPNFATFWRPRPDPARYAVLAARAARAIRRADRRATIVTGGLAPTLDFLAYRKDWGFLTAAARAAPGWLRPFDAAAFHPYTFLQAPPPEDDVNVLAPSVPHQIDDFRARVAEAEAGDARAAVRHLEDRGAGRHLWITEIGWHTAPDSGTPGFPPGVSELDQARYLVRATALALAAGVERVCWYTATDYANFLHDKEAAFGLFRWPPSATPDAKPAFTAAATFARLLGRTRFARDARTELGLPPDAYALAFRRSRHASVLVLWATRDGVPATLPAGRVRLVEMDGMERAPGATLTLGPSPIYLILQEGRR